MKTADASALSRRKRPTAPTRPPEESPVWEGRFTGGTFCPKSKLTITERS